jgi:hypothetical protein
VEFSVIPLKPEREREREREREKEIERERERESERERILNWRFYNWHLAAIDDSALILYLIVIPSFFFVFLFQPRAACGICGKDQ